MTTIVKKESLGTVVKSWSYLSRRLEARLRCVALVSLTASCACSLSNRSSRESSPSSVEGKLLEPAAPRLALASRWSARAKREHRGLLLAGED